MTYSLSSRAIRALAIPISLVVVLAGCSPTGSATEPPASVAAVTPAPAASEAPAASASAEAPATAAPTVDPASLTGTITFKYFDAGWEPFKDVVTAFNKVYPNIKVTFKQTLLGDYQKALPLELNSNTPADIYQLNEPDIPQYADFQEDLTPYAVATWGADWKSIFAAGALDQMMNGDKLIDVPEYLSGAGSMWYRPDLFEKAGIAAPPTTYDELKDDVAKLKAAGIPTPFVEGAKDGWINTDFYMALASQTAPGVIYEANAGTKPWTDPGLVAAMDAWKAFFTDGLAQQGALAATQYPDGLCAFETGKAALWFNGTWHNISMTRGGLDQYKTGCKITADVEWLPFNFPDINGDGKPSLYTQGTHGYFINNKSTNKDLAWTFLAWLTSKDGGQVFMAKGLNGPVVKGIEPDLSTMVYPAAVKAVEAQRAYIASGGYGGPRQILAGATASAMADALAAVAAGTQTSEDAMAAVQAAWSSEH